MVIDNKKTIIALRLRKLLLIIGLTVAVVLLFYVEIMNKERLGFDQKYLIIAFIAVYLVYYFWGLVRGYHYFYFSDLSPSRLVFRFSSLAPLSKRQNSAEIGKEDFYNFGFENKVFGLRQYLVLYQKTPRGIAKYRPISISLLTKSQKRDLAMALSLYKKVK